MLRHYALVAVRSLRRDWTYTLLNGVGLAVAMAACLVIGLFVRHERSYDRFFSNADRVFRILQASPDDETISAPLGLAAALEASAPEVEHATVVNALPEKSVFVRGTEPFLVDDVFRTDPSFLDVFPYRLLRGERRTALDRPGTVVLTEALARRLFGDADPLGQTLALGGKTDVTVTAVMEDPPTNAHIRPQALLSLTEAGRETRYGSTVEWNWYSGPLYVALVPGSDPASVVRTIGRLMVGAVRNDTRSAFVAQPVPAIHLHSRARYEITPQSDARYLVLFSVVGGLVLLLACVNYVNLATARATRRAREIGVRKALGAGRGQVQRQFLGEALVLVALALPVALGLTAAALPVVNAIAGLELTMGGLADVRGVAALLGFVLAVGMVAGAYPAVVLARLGPVAALRGQAGGRQSALRAGLVVFQLGAAVVLVVGTLVVQRQIEFVRAYRLGFDQSHVVTVSLPDDVRERYAAFRQEVLRSPAVAAVTSGIPLGTGGMVSSRPPDASKGQTETLSTISVDPDYAEAMGLTLVAGRFFSPEFPSDSASVVITEAAVRYYGLTGDAVGQQAEGATVVGVVADVHNATLREAVGPIAFTLAGEPGWTASVRIRPGATAAALADLERTWTAFEPDAPVAFAFLEQEIQAQYQSELRLARLFGLFSGLALLIAVLGLFGLVTYAVQQRAKEIGIRKVLGATAAGLAGRLSWEFVRLAAVALAVAVPVSVLLAGRWLSTFAFHIEVGPGVFVAAGALLVVVVLLAVGLQALRAATADPIRALRSE